MRRLFSFASPTAESPPRVHPEVEAWAIRAATSNGFGGELVAGFRRAGAATPYAASIDLSDPLASAVVRARRAARRVVALTRLLRRRARHRRSLRQLGALDAATLRDLGLTHSEIGSVIAEASGRAAPTRRPFAEHEWYRLRAGLPVGAGTVL